MQRVRATTISSLLAAMMSVYVCLLVVDVQALALRASTVAAAQSQIRKSANSTLSLQTAPAEVERPVEAVAEESVRLSSQDEKAIANSTTERATFCALLSKYLSLS
jgi:hypothetical protein